MFGLVDCNNFFASCERVFDPSLTGKPVVVLSNNDGCVIARSQEAKDLGIPMGEAAFKIKELIREGRVTVFSSNYALYGDMSNRVMATLSSFVPEIEVYSIDEAFLHLEGIVDLVAFGKEIVRVTTRHTGIPVSLGIAPTKTLAKMANHFAKKHPGYERVCIIDTEEKRLKALQLTPVGEVWGVGRKHRKMLEYHSIHTAYDLAQRSRSWVRRQMTVVGERMWMELQGIPSVSDEQDAEKKQICTSRSFGRPVREFTILMEAVANFAASCSRKLRRQQSYARVVIVTVSTSWFKSEEAQYYQSHAINLTIPTHDTAEIIGYCRTALEKIYKKGYDYKRAGVIVADLIPESSLQLDLFDKKDREKQKRLSQAIDAITKKNGTDKIKVAVQGDGILWAGKREFISRRYTTNLSEIIEVKTRP
ncbi:MAG: Y-family DNA polymerase [Tannerellaceae bacterium]|jgi:DNA polymerase V|nr:Y-family DNA polymerase [Tannerellaceae bacterium]